MLTVFDRLQGMAAVGALELQWGSYFLAVDKGLATDLAFELTAAACIIVDVLMWCTTERTYGIFRNGASLAFLGFDRFDGFAITQAVILVPEQPVLFDEGFDDGKLISEELLIFGAVEFVMGPLFQRDISADKENKPADLLMLFLNDSK